MISLSKLLHGRIEARTELTILIKKVVLFDEALRKIRVSLVQ